MQIGQVYVGELDVTFLNLPLTRYSLKGMKITPSFGLMLADGSYEDVPLGVFNISEASWTMSGLVVKAYDNMSLLDLILTKYILFHTGLRISEFCGLTVKDSRYGEADCANAFRVFCRLRYHGKLKYQEEGNFL